MKKMFNNIHKYKGDEFSDLYGEDIEVRNDDSDPRTPCYEIRFLDSNIWYGNIDYEEIEWLS